MMSVIALAATTRTSRSGPSTGPDDAGPSGADRTSFVCSAQNKPGAVHDLEAPPPTGAGRLGLGVGLRLGHPASSGTHTCW